MRAIVYLLAGCLALALLRVALATLMVGYAVLLVIAMLTNPGKTFGMLAFFLACFLLTEHTVAALVTGCVVLLACAIAKRREG